MAQKLLRHFLSDATDVWFDEYKKYADIIDSENYTEIDRIKFENALNVLQMLHEITKICKARGRY